MVWNASSTSSGPGFIGNVLLTMGEQKGMAYLEKLARQKIVSIDASARQVLDTVVAGEHPIALQIFNHHTVISAAKGAPVDWIAMEPVMALVSTVSVLKDAPHPNAGRLLMDFILSEQGQKIFAAADYLPAMPSVPAKVPSLKPEVGNYKVNVVTPEQVANDLPRWKAIFDKMFR
jgi:iron(III) transport system substrate-binding protein